MLKTVLFSSRIFSPRPNAPTAATEAAASDGSSFAAKFTPKFSATGTQHQDRFTKSGLSGEIRFGQKQATQKILPTIEEALPEADLKKIIGDVSSGNGFLAENFYDALGSKTSSKNDFQLGFENFAAVTLKILPAMARSLDKVKAAQQYPGVALETGQGPKEALEDFERCLPPEARNRSFRSTELHRIMHEILREQWINTLNDDDGLFDTPDVSLMHDDDEFHDHDDDEDGSHSFHPPMSMSGRSPARNPRTRKAPPNAPDKSEPTSPPTGKEVDLTPRQAFAVLADAIKTEQLTLEKIGDQPDLKKTLEKYLAGKLTLAKVPLKVARQAKDMVKVFDDKPNPLQEIQEVAQLFMKKLSGKELNPEFIHDGLISLILSASHGDTQILEGISNGNMKEQIESYAKGRMDDDLRRFLSGFVKQYSALDRTLPNFVKYIFAVAEEADAPAPIQKVAGIMKTLHQEIVKGIENEKLIKPMDKSSVEGLKHRLGELYDESQPPEGQAMNETAYYKTKNLLERLQASPTGSQEAAALANQLRTILHDIPWTKTDLPDQSSKKVKDTLDKDHYGLEKAKTEITEEVAAQQYLKNLKKIGVEDPEQKAPQILCLVGPPGVGKTSIGRSIANATGRKFNRISLGGNRDTADIKGHRPTYVGARPGRIIEALRQAKTLNPVIMLDEIDKLKESNQGDPAAALLEVLDPEQNNAFVDDFAEVPVDLSDVLFITTANYEEQIPEALKDRMKVIRLKGYTGQDKLHIAREFLIPRALDKYGLSKKQLKQLKKEPTLITDGAILRIIQEYAPEQGVRVLEREINTIARKIAARFADVNPRTITAKDIPTVGLEDVKSYLDGARFQRVQVDKELEPGVGHGLFYTQGPQGGGVLDVGAHIVKINKAAKPEMAGLVIRNINGNLEKEMEQSVKQAFSYIERKAHKFGLEKLLKNYTITMDFNTGELNKKDGPSAGGIITLSILSQLFSATYGEPMRLRANLGMTGAFNPLNGKITQIGGVREKVCGAFEEGVENFILPEQNRTEYEEDVPEEIREQLDVTFVDTLDQAIERALEKPVTLHEDVPLYQGVASELAKLKDTGPAEKKLCKSKQGGKTSPRFAGSLIQFRASTAAI